MGESQEYENTKMYMRYTYLCISKMINPPYNTLLKKQLVGQKYVFKNIAIW